MPKPVTLLNPKSAPPLLGLFSHVAITEPGRLAFVAGQVAIDAKGATIAPGDLAGQVPAVFDAISRILGDLGASMSDVVQLTTYVVGEERRPQWGPARNAVYERIFPDKQYPPNTLLFVSGLAKPEFVVEISAIARLPS